MGKSNAARSREVVEGAVIFRAALSCVDGEDDRTAQYFVTPRQRGGFVVFAIIGNNAAGGGAANRPKPHFLGRAAPQSATPGGQSRPAARPPPPASAPGPTPAAPVPS